MAVGPSPSPGPVSLPGDMIACACHGLCLYISAAPSVVYDAIMDLLSPCVGNGGLGSQLSDAQKMTLLLKENETKNVTHHFSAEDHRRWPPIQVSPLASQPTRGWPRGALPPAGDKIGPAGLSNCTRRGCSGFLAHLPPAPLTSLWSKCLPLRGRRQMGCAFHCGCHGCTQAAHVAAAGHGGLSVPFLENAKGSIRPQQVASPWDRVPASWRMWASHLHLPQAPEPHFK